jgi:RHS repeat-associated protein
MKRFIVWGIILLLILPILANAGQISTPKDFKIKINLTGFNNTLNETNATDINQSIPDLNETNTTEIKPSFNQTIEINETIFNQTLSKLNETLITSLVPLNITKPENISLPLMSEGVKRHIYANNRLMADISNEGINYYHQDNLRNNRLITDQSGEKTAEFKSLPFGQQTTNTGIKTAFSGKEMDLPNLYYFGARYYDSNLGRFLRTDPVYNPQDSPYSYVKNNPLAYFDPDGREVHALGSELKNYPIKKYLRVASNFLERTKWGGKMDNYNLDIEKNVISSNYIFLYQTNKNKPISFSLGPYKPSTFLAYTDPKTTGVTFNFKDYEYKFKNKEVFFHTLLHETAHQIDLTQNKKRVARVRSTEKGAVMDELRVSIRVFKFLKLDQDYNENKVLWQEIGFSKIDYSRMVDYSRANIDHYLSESKIKGVTNQQIKEIKAMYDYN